MDTPDTLILNPIAHPNPQVHRLGFGLDHPYVELCWGAVVGPTCTLLLRRAQWLWHERVPAQVATADFASSLGLGPRIGRSGPLCRSLERLERFGLAESRHARQFDIYTELPPLTERQLAGLPGITHRAHENLLSRHLDRIANPERDVRQPFPSRADFMRQRLDRLEVSRPAHGLSIH